MIHEVPRSPIDWDALTREIHDVTRPNRLDRALLAAAPGWGNRRLKARQEAGYRRAMLAVGQAYNTVWGSHERSQTHLPLTTEDALLPGFDRLQILQEGRQLYRNSPVIRALVDGVARRVGSPVPHFHTSNEDWNKEAKEQYDEWALHAADYTGCQTLEEMDEQIVRSIYTDGDIGEIDTNGRYLGKDTLGEPVFDLALQLIESDRIAPDQRININIDTMNPMAGVWVDWKTGRVDGYQVGQRGIGGLLIDSEFKPAHSMALYFRNARIEQRRGIPLLHPVINPAKDLERYLNAVRISMNVAASYGVFIERENAAQLQLQESRAQANAQYRTKPLQNGLMTWLNPGEKVSQLDPKIPGPDFDQVSRFMVRLIARGGGSIYEMVMGDFSGMSYSASKTVLMFVWSMQDEWQNFLIRRRKRRVYEKWVARRMEAGLLPFNPEAFSGVSWIKAAKSGFDPLEDAEAIVKMIGVGGLNYQRYFASLGLDWKVELGQTADEVEFIYDLAKDRGVPPEVIASALAPGVMQTGDSAQPAATGPGTTRRGGAQD